MILFVINIYRQYVLLKQRSEWQLGSQCKFKKPVLQVWKSFQDWSIYVFSSKDTCTSSTSIFKMYSLRQTIIFIAARVWFISDLLPCFLANLISFLLDKALADLYSIILQVGWRFGRKKNQSGIFFLHFFFWRRQFIFHCKILYNSSNNLPAD